MGLLSKEDCAAVVSSRCAWVAFVFVLVGLFGICGLQRLYVGRVCTGILQLLTLGLFGVWQVSDMVQILLGVFCDAQGGRLEWGCR